MTVTERSFATFDELASILAVEVVGRLKQGVERRGTAGLMVTGGGTPAPAYQAMAKLDAPWSKVEITLSDERWVDVDDPASNESMVRKSLLNGRAAAARLIGLKTADSTPAAAEPALNRAIEAMPRPFEAVLLGMGDDGHVASLFPHAPELAQARGLSPRDGRRRRHRHADPHHSASASGSGRGLVGALNHGCIASAAAALRGSLSPV